MQKKKKQLLEQSGDKKEEGKEVIVNYLDSENEDADMEDNADMSSGEHFS